MQPRWTVLLTVPYSVVERLTVNLNFKNTVYSTYIATGMKIASTQEEREKTHCHFQNKQDPDSPQYPEYPVPENCVSEFKRTDEHFCCDPDQRLDPCGNRGGSATLITQLN